MSNDDPVAGDQLKSFIERIERLEEEAKTINEDKAEVYAEAKGNGYDVKVMKKVVAIRRRDPDERREEEAILDLYLQAVGESSDKPTVVHQMTTKPSKVEKAAAAVAPARPAEKHEVLPGNEEHAYLSVKALVLAERDTSAGFIQRRFQIPLKRAMGFVSRLEEDGVIGPPIGGKRDILTVDERVARAAQDLAKTGAELEISEDASPVVKRAAEAYAKAGGTVVKATPPKPLVGSFTPPADPAPADDEDSAF